MIGCFDSNIVIDALKGNDQARAALRVAERRVLSIVTWIEVLAGCRTDDERASARRLMAACQVIPLASDVAEETVRIRSQRRLKLPDAAVLATARVSGCQLVTRNTKDFPADDPDIHVPYRL